MPGPSYTDSPLFRADGTVACKGDALFLKSVTINDTLFCDTLAERIAAAGITADGVLLKDGDVYVALKVGHLSDSDTFLQFTPNQILLQAQGLELLTMFGIGGVGEVVVNQSGIDVDFRVETADRPSALQIDGQRNSVNLSGTINTIGDGGATDHVEIDVTGDVVFKGGAGLTFAEIYASDNATATTITLAGQANKVQVTIFNADGVSNNMTPDHTNDHITVVSAGMYLCTCSIAIASVGGGGADTFGFSIYKNNGATEFVNCHAHRKLTGGGGDLGSVSISGIIDLAAADTIELWAWNESSADNVLIEDVTLSLMQIGGT